MCTKNIFRGKIFVGFSPFRLNECYTCGYSDNETRKCYVVEKSDDDDDDDDDDDNRAKQQM